MTTYPQIDYTSRDWLSLVQDMTALIDSRVPEWTDRSSNDFGMVMIELFAYMGDILSYYGDRIANEAFLPTATQRESVLAIARLLDYFPSGPTAASVGLKFSNTTSNYQWVVKGTQCATKPQAVAAPNPSKPFDAYQLASQAPVYFETVQDVLVPPNGSASVTAVEGATYNEATGTSNGFPGQDFPLFRAPVIDHSVSVLVGSTRWNYYERLVDAYSTTRAYTLETDGDNIVHVVFGDGANGAIPPLGQNINVTYRVGGGKRGNVAAADAKNIANTGICRILSTVPAGIKVTNPAPAVGGGEAETIEQIKANAPRALFALQRAVSLADFSALALRVGGVAKVAVPRPATYSSVTMYVAPVGGADATVDTSGNPIPSYLTLQTRVQRYLDDKIPLGTTVTQATPTYVPLKLTIAIKVKPKYKQEETRQAALKTMDALFAFDNVVFGDIITVKDVHTALSTVAGIDQVTISEMGRDMPTTIDLDTFDTVPSGTGWTLDTSVKISGTGSARHVNTGSCFRTFAPLDISTCTEIQLRGSYTAASTGYLVSSLTLTDVNNVVWPLGSTANGSAHALTAGDFNAIRWKLVFPTDPDVFDSTQVVRYDLTVRPVGIPGNTFWIDMMQVYAAQSGDIVLGPAELPAPFINGAFEGHAYGPSVLIMTASGGLLKS